MFNITRAKNECKKISGNQCYSLYEIFVYCITAILIFGKVVGGSKEARPQNKKMNGKEERGEARR